MNRPDERDPEKERDSKPSSNVDVAYRFLTHHLSTTEQPKHSHDGISGRVLNFKERWKRLIHKKSA